MALVERVALVTGAGSGIGRAAALLLAAGGHTVVLLGRREGPLCEVEAEIARLGGSVRACVECADLAVEGAAAAMIDRVARRFGRLDVLVNNAGGGRLIPIGATESDTLRRDFALNALAPMEAAARAWRHFETQRSGCVVNISSMATIDPFPGFFSYAASKAAMNVMVKSIAKEGTRIGVRAFSIAPGAVETPLLRSILDERAVPSAACLSPEDVGRLVMDCVEGRREADNGRTIAIVREGSGARTRVLEA